MAIDWPQVLGCLVAGQDLTDEQSAWAMDQVLSGAATPAQVAGFATGLRAKGESPTEVAAMAGAMLAQARLVPVTAHPVLDVVGTGGDQLHTVNISTMAALVCAAAGAHVVKHGNRAASSSTGTADVLETLGVAIDLEPSQVAACVESAGIGFCFAPVHHPAMRHAAGPRRELGIPTAFNILGPLTNPGGATAALIGCASEQWAPIMAAVLAKRGVRSLVVRGLDGLDEISIGAATRVWDTRSGDVVESVIDVAELGIPRAGIAALRGGDSHRNAELLVKALGPCSDDDPDIAQVHAIRDAVAVNAAGALAAYEAAGHTGPVPAADAAGVLNALQHHLGVARSVIESGAALRTLTAWSEVSQQLKQ